MNIIFLDVDGPLIPTPLYFEDVYFYDEEVSQIVVDFDSGILYKDYITALKHFGLEEGSFVL